MNKRESGVPVLDVDRPFAEAVCIHRFNAPLTYYHSSTLGPVAAYEVLGMLRLRIAFVEPSVKLHGNHVLMLSRWAGRTRQSSPEELAKSISDWIGTRGYTCGSPHRVWRATTRTPIEDGFFTCICVTNGPLVTPQDLNSDGRLEWEMLAPNSSEIGALIVKFMEEERQHIGDPCDRFLEGAYGGDRNAKKSGNRKFFMNEYSLLEFAASILSENELRFWSRPVNWPP